LNLCFLRPRGHNQNKSIGSAVFAQLPILYNGRRFPPKLSLAMGDLDFHLTQCFLGPIRAHNSNGISIGSAVFAQMTAECPYTLQLDAHYPLKIAQSLCDLDPIYYTWFLGPTRVLNSQPKRHLDRFSRFAGLTIV